MHAAAKKLMLDKMQAMPKFELDRHGHVANFHLIGLPWADVHLDWFYFLLNSHWSRVLAVLFTMYVCIVTFFALLFFCDRESIRGARPGFADAFYFSVQTLSTAGYGYLSPQSTFANVLCLLEAFSGLSFVALFTGVLFARASKPKARIVFTKHLVTHDDDGQPCLFFRVVNQRKSQIMEARAQASVLIKSTTIEGETSYQYRSLKLDEPNIPLFVGGWRLRHVIDRSSPLFGLTSTNASDLGITAIQVRASTDYI